MKLFPIKEYESEYSITKDGRVFNTRTDYEIKIGIGKNGYPFVDLWKSNKPKRMYIHRLLAETFIEPFIGETVNHIDGDKTNNHLSNLEWSTYKENNAHAYKTGLKTISDELAAAHGKRLGERNKSNSYRSIPIDVFDLNDNFIASYKSIKESAETLGINRVTVMRALKGEVKKPKQYKFKYKEEI